MLVVYLGIGTGLDSWYSVASAPIPLLLAILARIRHEERLLHEGLGGQYTAYARGTKRLVPGIW
jgi:protein-S-isoprenylcysteine O-methyltransferase Ste14